jgi:hypothetical protein
MAEDSPLCPVCGRRADLRCSDVTFPENLWAVNCRSCGEFSVTDLVLMQLEQFRLRITAGRSVVLEMLLLGESLADLEQL